MRKVIASTFVTLDGSYWVQTKTLVGLQITLVKKWGYMPVI